MLTGSRVKLRYRNKQILNIIEINFELLIEQHELYDYYSNGTVTDYLLKYSIQKENNKNIHIVK